MRGVGQGDPALVETSPHWTTAPIQLQEQTRDVLLNPGIEKQGNILLLALEGLEHGEMATWTWPWEIKAPTCVWWLLSLGDKG